MSDTADLLARFEAIVGRLEQMAGPEITPLAYSIPPGHVAAGELIESAWGNSVVDTFAAYATHSSHNAGDTIQSGPLIQTRVQTLTTDPAGLVTCGFRYPYASNPGVVGWPASTSVDHIFTVNSIGTTSFQVLVRAANTGLPAGNATMSIVYIAIGARL